MTTTTTKDAFIQKLMSMPKEELARKAATTIAHYQQENERLTQKVNYLEESKSSLEKDVAHYKSKVDDQETIIRELKKSQRIDENRASVIIEEAQSRAKKIAKGVEAQRKIKLDALRVEAENYLDHYVTASQDKLQSLNRDMDGAKTSALEFYSSLNDSIDRKIDECRGIIQMYENMKNDNSQAVKNLDSFKFEDFDISGTVDTETIPEIDSNIVVTEDENEALDTWKDSIAMLSDPVHEPDIDEPKPKQVPRRRQEQKAVPEKKQRREESDKTSDSSNVVEDDMSDIIDSLLDRQDVDEPEIYDDDVSEDNFDSVFGEYADDDEEQENYVQFTSKFKAIGGNVPSSDDVIGSIADDIGIEFDDEDLFDDEFSYDIDDFDAQDARHSSTGKNSGSVLKKKHGSSAPANDMMKRWIEDA